MSVWLAWSAILVLIPCLSFNGRGLRDLVYGSIGPWWLGLLFLSMTVGAFVAYLAWLHHRRGDLPLVSLLLLSGLFLFLPLSLSMVDERLHFLAFGAFGFFSMMLFSPLTALGVVVLTGGLDKLLQWLLPDRVGDWRDVGFNLLAGLGGCSAAWLGRR